MLNSKRITVILPAYNAAQTLEMTYREIPFDIVDDVLLVDDASQDDTADVARRLGRVAPEHQQPALAAFRRRFNAAPKDFRRR